MASPNRFELRQRHLAKFPAFHHPAGVGEMADEEILGHAHLGDKVKFLVDDRNTGRDGLRGGLKDDIAAADAQSAAGGQVCAAERFEQG